MAHQHTGPSCLTHFGDDLKAWMCLLPTAYQSDTNDYCSREGLNGQHLNWVFIYLLSFSFFDLFCSILILSKSKSMYIWCGFLQSLIFMPSIPCGCDMLRMGSDIKKSFYMEFHRQQLRVIQNDKRAHVPSREKYMVALNTKKDIVHRNTLILRIKHWQPRDYKLKSLFCRLV